MRAVLQRVRSASVSVDGVEVSRIRAGVLALVGVAREDGPDDCRYIAQKTVELRIFEDEAGKMNRALADVGGTILAVSQFTLYGDTRKGRRPSFDSAAPADAGRLLFDETVRQMRELGAHVETGVFQAHMVVSLENDGPVTILVDSRKDA
jgi:D-tyrosyl-tRNA(Tyr) deacylase